MHTTSQSWVPRAHCNYLSYRSRTSLPNCRETRIPVQQPKMTWPPKALHWQAKRDNIEHHTRRAKLVRALSSATMSSIHPNNRSPNITKLTTHQLYTHCQHHAPETSDKHDCPLSNSRPMSPMRAIDHNAIQNKAFMRANSELSCHYYFFTKTPWVHTVAAKPPVHSTVVGKSRNPP